MFDFLDKTALSPIVDYGYFFYVIMRYRRSEARSVGLKPKEVFHIGDFADFFFACHPRFSCRETPKAASQSSPKTSMEGLPPNSFRGQPSNHASIIDADSAP